MEPSDCVEIGRIVAPHGRRGTLKVRATGSGRHLRAGVVPFVAGRRRPISQVRTTPKGYLVDLEGVEHRSEADALRGEALILERRELDAPQEEEFYVGDLVGLIAVGESGEVLGRVEDSFETPAHEVLVVRESDDAPPFYVPFTHEHVPRVDLAAGRVSVHPPEG